MNIFDLAKQIGVIIALLTTLYGIGDKTGWRFAWKWEVDEQGWFNRRQSLFDRIRDGKATEHEIGEYCGLSFALKQPPGNVSC